MKNLALLALLISAPAFAASPYESATVAAITAFRLDFKSEKGVDAPQPLGYFLENESEEILTTVYFLDGADLKADVYGCHQHGANFDCHREDRATLGSYTRSSSLYSAELLNKSVPLALDFFEANVAPVSTVKSVKLWEAEQNIRYSITFEKNGTEQKFFIGCHFHGGGMDCHRKRDAGPGEPKN